MSRPFLLAVLCLASFFLHAQTNPESVTIAGSLQLALGCSEDWQPACESSRLSYDADADMWLANFDLPAGDYEYKAALNGDWGENYGLNATANGDNIPLSLAADSTVTFFYDHKTHWITDSVNALVATVPGNYQAAVGCPDDWRPECMRTWLQDPDGDGIFAFSIAIPAGSYECKVAINRNWTENYGADGVLDGDNIAFTVGPSEVVTFTFDPASKLLDITSEVVVGSDNTVTLVGSFQDELGCSADWLPDCANSYLTKEDEIWQASFTLPAGEYEYKVTLNNSWDENYGQGGQAGGDNLTLTLSQETSVKFYYADESHWVTDNQSCVIATVAGNFQEKMGCAANWDPSCLASWLQDLDGDGIYSFTTSALPFGLYECKVAINESWDENYGESGEPGGANIAFLVPADNRPMHFSYDATSHVLKVESEASDDGSGSEPSAAYAVIHYQRAAGDYGDPTSPDYNDYWGLHLWGDSIDAADLPEWSSPKPFLGETEYGRFAFFKLSGTAGPINFIAHRGDVKDGDADRAFDPNSIGSYDVYLKNDDPNVYASQAAAQGYATIRYQREDGNYGVGTENYWGLHLWSEGGANAIDPSAETDWLAPRAPDAVDAFGAYWRVPLNSADAEAAKKPLKFILHTPGGDNTEPDGNREPGGDRAFIPAEMPSAWILEQDESNYKSHGAAKDFVFLHYRRPAGDYGDTSSDDFNQYWGMHNWTGAANPVAAWDQPIKPAGYNDFGSYYKIDLLDGATELAYLLHKGDEKDPGPDQSIDLLNVGHEVWQVQADETYVFPIVAEEPGGINAGNLASASAFWLTGNTLLWPAASDPQASYRLHYAPEGGLATSEDGITGGSFISLTQSNEIDPRTLVRFPHLIDVPALRISEQDMPAVEAILKGQFALSMLNGENKSLAATSLQYPAVLDDLYYSDTMLGVDWSSGAPDFALWAPTAKTVNLQLYADGQGEMIDLIAMEWDNGVWRANGTADWKGRYYQYDVEVYVPSSDSVEHNLVTDPYSVGLSTNSERSYLMDLNDAAFKPEGWDNLQKPALATPEDISIYELHIRDFSIFDESVPAEIRGKFKAFTLNESNGMNHLKALQQSGLSHLHILPAFDIATVNEDASQRLEPDLEALQAEASDSDQQQAIITASGDADAYNWGYDPFHYSVPEGSYTSNPEGGTRTLEFREMVQSLNQNGLRLVMDVVYNHTNASGQNPKSVLDRIVPGYYHRLNNQGQVERSTCCENTASEHLMMEKLMMDSLVMWAKAYKVDAFRFDLMGHHMRSNMETVRNALHGLTQENDGVDGTKIYLYGEGWNFGEVADGARGVNATQHNLGGLGIGTFSDRMRDAVRGGGPFDNGESLKLQGFANGLFYDPNDLEQGDSYTTLMEHTDRIRVELAGNLADYAITDHSGNLSLGRDLDYNGQRSGYTQDPQELISYISKHDNQTLYDINVYGAPQSTSMSDRVRIQVLGLSLVALGQGIPFFHAGVDLLRSKSLDRDSFNSGDWFNRLDFTFQSNNFGVGLPVADKNQDNWWLMGPLLANPALSPDQQAITRSGSLFRELLQIRASSKLFRLETAQDIMDRLSFHNTGPQQLPGLIAMYLSDTEGDDLDANYLGIMVCFNANNQEQTLYLSALADKAFDLHPVQVDSQDELVKQATYSPKTGRFVIPARTTAVFVETVPPTPWEVISGAIAGWQVDGTLSQRQAEHLHTLGMRMLNDPGSYRPYFKLSVNRYVDWGYLSNEQASILLVAAEDI